MQDTYQVTSDAHNATMAYSPALLFRLAKDRRVGSAGFRILLAMLASGLRGKYVQTSQRALQHDIGLSQSAVSKGCSQLVAVGVIDRSTDNGRYTINPHLAYGGSLEAASRARRYCKSQQLTERTMARIIKDLGNGIAPDDMEEV